TSPDDPALLSPDSRATAIVHAAESGVKSSGLLPMHTPARAAIEHPAPVRWSGAALAALPSPPRRASELDFFGSKFAASHCFSARIGTRDSTLHMWDEHAPAWSRHFRLVRYDRRGHGKSSVPKGPYPMERLGRDVLAMLDSLGIAKINWCGLSMGGMVGQWLGANAPDRIDKLILSNISSYFADKTMWEGRLKTVREKGLAAIVDANMERWFTKDFRERNPQAIARMHEIFLATKPDGYIGCGEGIRDMDHRALLGKITAPTLVIAGRNDPPTTLEANEYIRAHSRRQAHGARNSAHRQCRTAAALC